MLKIKNVKNVKPGSDCSLSADEPIREKENMNTQGAECVHGHVEKVITQSVSRIGDHTFPELVRCNETLVYTRQDFSIPC